MTDVDVKTELEDALSPLIQQQKQLFALRLSVARLAQHLSVDSDLLDDPLSSSSKCNQGWNQLVLECIDACAQKERRLLDALKECITAKDDLAFEYHDFAVRQLTNINKVVGKAIESIEGTHGS